MTGSHQQQAYWYATGRHRLIGKLPAMYLIPEMSGFRGGTLSFIPRMSSTGFRDRRLEWRLYRLPYHGWKA